MIRTQNAASLAIELCKIASAVPGRRACYLVCPSSMTATSLCEVGEVPMMTGHGSASALGQLIHSYHQWGEPIRLGIVLADDGLQFWVENERNP